MKCLQNANKQDKNVQSETIRKLMRHYVLFIKPGIQINNFQQIVDAIQQIRYNSNMKPESRFQLSDRQRTGPFTICSGSLERT